MPRFGRKNTFEKIFFSKVTLFIIVVISVYFSTSVFERYQVERDMAARRESVELQHRDLEARKAALEARVEYLEDERGVEAEIRKNFDVAKEGEQVVIIVDSETVEQATSAPSTIPVNKKTSPWYQFW